MSTEKEKEKSYKEIHGHTRVGGIFRFIGKKAPQLLGKGLDILGGQVGLGELGKAIGLVEKEADIDPKDKEYLLEELRLAFEEKKLEVEAENNRLKDVQDSRDHGKELSKSEDKFVRRFKHILATIVISATIILLLILIFFTVPEENQDLLKISFGIFIGGTTTVLGYYFGTSQSSTDKNKTIEDLKKKRY